MTLKGRAVVGVLAILCFAAPPAVFTAAAEEPAWKHGSTLMGELKYPPDFKHFDYVNPDAPKTGTVRLASPGTFDTLNFVIPQGTPAGSIIHIYETLMTPSYDEVGATYGLLAEGFRRADDYSSASYRLRPEARWHDGKPVTPEDVVWSFEVQKELNPQRSFYYRHVTKAEKTGEREVTFTFDQPGNRELPQIVSELVVLPKHWWEGTDANGEKRSIRAGTLEPPLGSGAYRVKSVNPGRAISYERVPDYWGKDLPVNIGENNFAEIRYDYYADTTVMLQAFKGDQYDFRMENSAKDWHTGYDFPALHEGKVIKEKVPNTSSGLMQAFVLNTRRAKFSDPRVRLAFNYAFNFEEMNRTIFYGEYQRSVSFFGGTELASEGLPQGRELEILNEIKGQVENGIPPEVFTTPYENPKYGDPRGDRQNLLRAQKLLEEAGWVIRNGKLTNAKSGEVMTVEYLSADPSFERVILPFAQSLRRLGIEVHPRSVDVSQYVSRTRSRDFDMVTDSWGQSLSPGNEQREYWGSEAADRPGSDNSVGIKNPAVDALIDKVIFATSRDDLLAATKALDRVLLWNHYVIPQWYAPSYRLAYWNRFGRPKELPRLTPGFPNIWWWDEEKARSAGGAR